MHLRIFLHQKPFFAPIHVNGYNLVLNTSTLIAFLFIMYGIKIAVLKYYVHYCF